MSFRPYPAVASLVLVAFVAFGSQAADRPQQQPPEHVDISVAVSPSPATSIGYDGVVTITDLDRNLTFGAVKFSFSNTHRACFRANVRPSSITFDPAPDSVSTASAAPGSVSSAAAVSLLVDVAIPPAGGTADFTVTYLLAGRPQAKASGHFALRNTPEA